MRYQMHGVDVTAPGQRLGNLGKAVSCGIQNEYLDPLSHSLNKLGEALQSSVDKEYFLGSVPKFCDVRRRARDSPLVCGLYN